MSLSRNISDLAQQVYAGLSLSPPVPEMRRPALIIMTGLPGTGKTHFALALCHAGNFTLVGSDPVRAAIFASPVYGPAENHIVFEVMDALIWRLLREHRDVICDAVNLSELRRDRLRTIAFDAGARPLTILTVAPEAVVRERLAARRASPPARGESEADWDVYCKLAGRMDRIRHEHVVVDTSQDIADSIEAILTRINSPST